MDITEERFSLFDIILMACFISLVFSPVGLVLMWLKSKWSKKVKLIISGAFVLVCAIAVAIFIFLHNSSNAGGGGGNPFIGLEQNADGGGGSGKSSSSKSKTKSNKSNKQSSQQTKSQSSASPFFESATKSRWFYFFLLVLIMAVIVAIKNLSGGKKKDTFNPYVDTALYKIPIPDGFVFPEVKYSKLNLEKDEKIYFATTAEMKDNPGDIVITNKRFAFLGRRKNYEFQISNISSIYSLSNTTLSLKSGEQTYYFFIHATQMRFVLQISRFAGVSSGK